jgi:IclR family pca regulon transcriptional regulator
MTGIEVARKDLIEGHAEVYLARSNTPRVVSVGYHAGARVAAHAVTPDIVMLACRPDAEVDEWIAAHDFSAFTASTVTDPVVFRSHVLAARSLGHAGWHRLWL